MFMQKIRTVMILLMSFFLAACKIEIFVPEGGRVESESGTYNCSSGETCYVDVTDLFFNETFIAVAEDGYWFQKWYKGNRYFCGNKSEPCSLFTADFDGNALLEAFLQREDVFYLQPLFRSDTAKATHKLSPAGGRYEFLNGVILKVPPGAVLKPTAVTMGELAAEQVNPALHSHNYALSEKRYLGGFSVSPDLEFDVPVTALVPIEGPGPYERPIQMEIEGNNKRYWVEPTNLVYLPKRRIARIQISHFSGHAVGAIDGIDPQRLENLCTDPRFNFLKICDDFDDLQPAECLLKRAQRPADTKCCREESFTARSEALDFISSKESGDCQMIIDNLNITYHECTLPNGKPAPAQKHGMCEVSPNCPEDKKLGYDVKIKKPSVNCFAKGESMVVTASVTDAEGNLVPNANVSWRIADQRAATVDLDGKVIAKGEGETRLEATYTGQCKDYVDAVPLRVLDLNGRWTGQEEADETDCEEGVNVYTRNVSVTHTGTRVVMKWGGGSVSGRKTGCAIAGSGTESEDDGISYSGGRVSISPDGSSMTGYANWKWKGTDPDTGETDSCSGSSRLMLSR